jgi:non-heme chloroperoxidase
MSSKTFKQRPKASAGRDAFIEVEPGVRLHVIDWGEGPPVILIPGYPLGAGMYEYTIHALVKAGFRAIGISTRGFGQSDKPYGKYDYEVFTDDIKVILETLDIKNACICGHSMGGSIAIRFVSKFAGEHISKLALFAAAAPRHIKIPEYPYPAFEKAEITRWIEGLKINRPDILGEIDAKFTFSATSVSAGNGAWLGGLSGESSPFAMILGLTALRDEELREDLLQIKVPTLLLHARQDHIAAFALAEQMHAVIKGSELVIFEKSGHALFLEEQEKFNDEFIKFLNK